MRGADGMQMILDGFKHYYQGGREAGEMGTREFGRCEHTTLTPHGIQKQQNERGGEESAFEF